jgi:hypothetical protein
LGRPSNSRNPVKGCGEGFAGVLSLDQPDPASAGESLTRLD